jgi:hypothetical protein
MGSKIYLAVLSRHHDDNEILDQALLMSYTMESLAAVWLWPTANNEQDLELPYNHYTATSAVPPPLDIQGKPHVVSWQRCEGQLMAYELILSVLQSGIDIALPRDRHRASVSPRPVCMVS